MDVAMEVARKCALRGRKENPLGGRSDPSGQAQPSMMPQARLLKP
jgi:hypothetical protein